MDYTNALSSSSSWKTEEKEETYDLEGFKELFEIKEEVCKPPKPAKNYKYSDAQARHFERLKIAS